MKEEKSFKKVFNKLLITLLFIIQFIVVAGGLNNRAMGEQQQQNFIKSISPESATIGETISLSIQMDESLGTPPIPPTDVVPEKVTINNIEGTNIQRNNYVISATFSIPGTESIGLKDVSIQFGAPPDQPNAQPLISTKVSAFEIVDDSGTGENPDDPNGGSPFSIENVQPSSAYTGDTITLQILLHGEMLPPSEAKPEIISIGTINGSNIDWNGSIATTTITIPTTEKIGAKDVTIQFPTPPDNPEPLIITGKSVFDVMSGSSSDTGSLKVLIFPQEAIDAGAKWQIDDGAWENSGTTISGLNISTYDLGFKSIDGWAIPSIRTVDVSSGGTTTINATYTQDECLAGDIDGNSIVNISDFISVLQILIGLTPDNIQICSDVNNDKKIGMQEVVFIFQSLLTPSQSGVIYVDADNISGVNNGNSWSTAHTTITDALAEARSGNEIWVAEGIYYPTNGTDRNASFNLIEGVTLYGGFTGSELSSNERNWKDNVTILSGDIGTLNDNSDNVYHVVIGSDNAVIDGFTIQDGNADFPNDGSGSLVETTQSDMEILRIVTNVKSCSGAGLLNVHAGTVTRNCIFKNNSAFKGGAVYNMVTKSWSPQGAMEVGTSPYFENCIFENNSATGRGGAVNSDFFTSPIYVNCQFINNHCDSKGGAVYNDMGAPSYFINNLFAENTSERGSAVVADGSSPHRFAYCSFIGNSSNDIGAALYQGTYMNDNMESGAEFRGNEVHLYHSLLMGNSSGSSTSSISNWHDSNISYDNNSIIEIVDGTYEITEYVDADTYISKNSNYGWKPDRNLDTETWLASLQSDKNNNFTAYSYDNNSLSGSATIVYVNDDAAEGGSGTSWSNAYNNLQEALDKAISGSQIWVAAGIYKPTNSSNREMAFVMKVNVDIYGGFDGVTDDELSDRNPTYNVTILSGDIGIIDNPKDNSYHVLFGSSESIIDGFTIQDGYADGTFHNSRGGGLLCYDGNSPSVSNCTFKNNYALEGGAIAAYSYSAPIIVNCTIESNSAEIAGGILFRVGPDTKENGAKISGTSFSENSATDRGGAVYIDYGAWPTFTNCTFTSNTAQGNAGAVYVDNNSSQLSSIQTWFDSCKFEKNTTQMRGGAFAIYEGTVYLSSSIISNNTANNGGGGIALNYYASFEADNESTISNNSSTTGESDIDDKSFEKKDSSDDSNPDLAAVAAKLGITETELIDALGDMSQKPDLAAAALKLGITEQELKDALGIP